MIWLQLTANTGPVECCLGVTKALLRLLSEAEQAGVIVQVLEEVTGPVQGTLRSVLVELSSAQDNVTVTAFADRWCGTMQWICESPYRLGHKRKNWFLGGAAFAPPQPVADSEIRYEATRASGPGGQHVNKTDSAIRATHIASGLSVKVQTERSQHANKKLAAQLLANKLAGLAEEKREKDKAARRLVHHQGERGNAQRVFSGLKFIER